MPGSPLDIIDGAIDELADLVTLSEAPGPTSHTAVIADGLDDRAAEALGRYLLGVLAGAVQLDARLSRKYMLSGASGHLEIVASVRRVVGETNVFDTITEKGFRDRTRNAWIGEGLAHALLVIRNRAETACLTGRVAAISKPHVIPSETGIDAVAIYDVDGEPFLAIGECKEGVPVACGKSGQSRCWPVQRRRRASRSTRSTTQTPARPRAMASLTRETYSFLQGLDRAQPCAGARPARGRR